MTGQVEETADSEGVIEEVVSATGFEGGVSVVSQRGSVLGLGIVFDTGKAGSGEEEE